MLISRPRRYGPLNTLGSSSKQKLTKLTKAAAASAQSLYFYFSVGVLRSTDPLATDIVIKNKTHGPHETRHDDRPMQHSVLRLMQ